MNFNLLKDWRILIMIFFIIGSVIAISPSFKSGVVVSSIDPNSPFYGKVSSGDILSWANEKEIKVVDDFYQFGNYTGVFRLMHNGKLDLANVKDGYTGIIVAEKSTTKLSLGIDLIGGTRILLKADANISDETMQQVISTLETRINVYGLRESKFQPVKDVSGNNYIQIEMAGGSREEVEQLLSKQGKFEGKISKPVSLEDDKGQFQIGKNNYNVTLDGENIVVNGNSVSINGTFELDGIVFEYANKTIDGVVLLAHVFSGSDIMQVCIQDIADACVSRVLPQSGGYEFMFQIYVTPESAQKFAKVTEGMKAIVDPNSGSSSLDGRVVLILDGNVITDLSISSDLKGKELTNPLITGFREDKDSANKEKLMLQSILQSGELPAKLETVKIDQISASLGQSFIKGTLIAGLIAAIAVSAVIFTRYRKLRILIPMMIWDMAEILILLGVAAAFKNFWTIDLASIAGIIAAIGTGTNDQIVMIDEILLGQEKESRMYTLKQRLKKAFFIIMGAAGTVVAAMTPLFFVGIGVMKGFAISTIIALFIGIAITRPAFGKVVEKILEKKETTVSTSKSP